MLGLVLLLARPGTAEPRAVASARPLPPPIAGASRLLAGVGDRLVFHLGGEPVALRDEARRRGLPTDLFEVWLPRSFRDSWLPQPALRRLAATGSLPVVVHAFFGDGISRERVLRERPAWHRSLGRLARLARLDRPVLVVLEPEFNDAPPPGETPITEWPGFAKELAEAARILRAGAPNLLVGTCPGDFSPERNLGPVLGPVAEHLDFLAFQEMRADTDPDAAAPGYLAVGRAAVDYARYLRRSFGRPLLLAYVAVSSHGGWEERQAEALEDLWRRRQALRDEGVFGVVYFQLRDDPAHTGFFGPAERHFGLLTAKGGPKPALRAFRRFSGSR